jgi:hypothetical protein
MLPIHENVLQLIWIAEYWSREINGVRTSAEIHDQLLAAYWRGELRVLGGDRDEGGLLNPVTFLKIVARERNHLGFVLVDSPEMIPPEITKHDDRSVTVDMLTYIVLPPDHTCWTPDIISSACRELSKLSIEDYHDLIQPGVLALRTTKKIFAAYCEYMDYDPPHFWFGDPTRKRNKAKNFGGRPSVMRAIEAEMRRRADAKVLAPRLRQEAEALRSWAEDNVDPDFQIPQVAAIENALRERYKELVSASSAEHKT